MRRWTVCRRINTRTSTRSGGSASWTASFIKKSSART
nr:MAG TPA: hypothetical protein [Caudoviricetes sp.]